MADDPVKTPSDTGGSLITTSSTAPIANKDATGQATMPTGDVKIAVDDGVSEKKGGGDGDEKKGETDEEAEKKKKEEEEKGGLMDFWRILKYGDGLDKTLQVIGLIFSMGSGAALPIMVIIFGELLTEMTQFLSADSDFTEMMDSFRGEVNKLTLYFVYLFIGKFFAGFFGAIAFRISATRISARIRLMYMKGLFGQDVSYLDTVGAGEVAVRITTNSNTLQAGIAEKFSTFWMALAMFITATVISFTYSWELTLVTVTMLPAIVIVYGITIPITIKKDNKLQTAYGAAATLAQEILATMRTIKALGAEKKLTRRYQRYLEEARKLGYDKIPLMSMQYSAGFMLIWAGSALSFWYGARMFSQGKISNPGDVFVVLFAVSMLTMAFGIIAMPITAIVGAASSAKKIFDVIDREPLMKQGPDLGIKPEKCRKNITFEEVSFSYPGKRKDVRILDHVSLEFEEGKNTAIVGPSGSGKSTIVSLLERWYDPDVIEDDGETTQGTVRVDGMDLKDINLQWWRSQIGLVQQEPFLFNDTILKNVAHGLLRTGNDALEKFSEEELLVKVKEACHEANADGFIEKLPEKYLTKVGEGGVKLSGGQKQRIAIARSIISQPSILILDEATSALDPKAETIVQHCLDKLSKTRTTITIAHRLSTIKKADRIVVLEKGRVVETGSHEELMRIEGGKYASLVAGQSLSLGSESGNHEKKLQDAQHDDARKAEAAAGETSAEQSSDEDNVQDSDKAKEEEKKQQFSIVECLTRVYWESRNMWLTYAIAVVGVLLGSVAVPIQAYLFAKYINGFTFLPNMGAFVDEANTWAMALAITAAGIGISYAILGYTFTKLEFYLTTVFRTEYFGNILRQPVPFFDLESSSSGTLSARLDSDPTAIQQMVGMNFGMLLVGAFSALGAIIISLCFGWKLALVGIFACFPFVLFAGVVRVYLDLHSDEIRAKVFGDSAQFAAEAVGAFRTVSSLTMENTITSRYETLLEGHVKKDFFNSIGSMALFSFADSVSFLAMALVFWYGTKLIIEDGYDSVSFFVIQIALINGAEQAGAFFAHSPNLASSAGSANRIFAMRETEDEKAKEAALKEMVWSGDEKEKSVDSEKASAGVDDDDDTPNGCSISLKNVSFTYPSRERPVIQNFNLEVHPGQFIAFVGASGCGKSTLISLLMGFYPLSDGTIEVDGTDISTVKLESYRRKVSLVAQEPVLYQGSIAYNVRLGLDPTKTENQDANITAEEDEDKNLTSEKLEPVKEACRLASISTFIDSLPFSYSTEIGTSGLGISGGQKQRLALARAIIRKPRLLLLDEATSSLDSHSEKEVLEALESFRGAHTKEGGKGVTVVAVAHRLATIRGADRIFVLDEGRVVEEGTHTELVERRGAYYEMCLAQALDK